MHVDCCDGKILNSGWGVLQCSSSELPTPIEGPDGRTFQFEVAHAPRECCYAHTELCCKSGDEFVEPSPKVKETFRVRLAQKMTIRIRAGQ